MISTPAHCEADVSDPHSGARPLLRQHSSALLNRILSECNRQHVVFDLDSTLLNNRPRSALIMREFAAKFNITALASAEADHWVDWSAAVAMANIGLGNAQIEKHVDDFEGFWFERFFTSEYCVHDEQVPGAVEFVNGVAREGASIIYLTGRPEPMRNGTLQCLSRLGFPVPESTAIDSVTLSMKPQVDGSDDDFKQQKALQLADTSVRAVFDNEPQHINTYKMLLPATESIHLFTDHSMRPIPLREDIPSIRDFTL